AVPVHDGAALREHRLGTQPVLLALVRIAASLHELEVRRLRRESEEEERHAKREAEVRALADRHLEPAFEPFLVERGEVRGIEEDVLRRELAVLRPFEPFPSEERHQVMIPAFTNRRTKRPTTEMTRPAMVAVGSAGGVK